VVQLPTAEEVLALEPDLSLIPDAMVGAVDHEHAKPKPKRAKVRAPRA